MFNKFYSLNCVYRPVHSPQVISQVLDRILICVLNEALQNVDLHLTHQIMLVGEMFLHRYLSNRGLQVLCEKKISLTRGPIQDEEKKPQTIIPYQPSP